MGAQAKQQQPQHQHQQQHQQQQQQPVAAESKLTVCDITGDWALYQWNLLVFSVLYGTLCGLFATIGPLWTLDLDFECEHNDTLLELLASTGDQSQRLAVHSLAGQQCKTLNAAGEPTGCTNFLYQDQSRGLILTNSFDLVCDREWLRSAISSSVLVGFLVSAIALGLLSDRYGRLICLRVGSLLAILATLLAILAPSYLALNAAMAFMNFALIGVENTLVTLIMEAASAKLRPLSVFQFGLGWGLGMACCPLLTNLTRNYKLTLAVALVWQLLLALWSYLSIFESIRWLLDEGRLTQAQVELQRVCRINGIANGTKLASRIAQIQLEQVQGDCRADKDKDQQLQVQQVQQRQELISLALRQDPSAAQKSFSLSVGKTEAPSSRKERKAESIREIIWRNMKPEDQSSATAQGLVHLAMEQSCNNETRKQARRKLESPNFVAKLFHPKFYKLSISLVLVNIMTEVGYYGLVQVHSIVGLDVDLNYLSGTAGEWIADVAFLLVLWFLSRRFALLLPGLLTVLVLLGIVLNYQLLPLTGEISNETTLLSQIDGQNSTVSSSSEQQQVERLSVGFVKLTGHNLEIYKLRELINFWLITVGKLVIAITSLVATMLAAEVFPSNLRQTAVGAMVFVARVCSILAPFLFQDLSINKHRMQVSLVVTSLLGLIGVVLSFWHVKSMKHTDLAENPN